MFKCNTVLNKTAIHECAKPMLKRTRMILYLLPIISGLLFLVMILSSNEVGAQKAVECAIYGVGELFCIVFCLVMCILYTKKTENKMLAQVQTMVHADSYEIKLLIDEECIYKEQPIADEGKSEINDEKKEQAKIYLKDIYKIHTTKNYIITMLNGNLYLIFDKNNIEGGSAEEFYSFLVDHSK